jgi:hypothetical protein
MSPQPHHVSGFFEYRSHAEAARDVLLQRGLPAGQMQIYASDTPPAEPTPTGDSNAVLKNVVVDGAVGTAVGTGLGALAQVALVAGNVNLFIASPLLAPLTMMGWGAGLGGLVGAAMGASTADKPAEPAADTRQESWLSNLVADAIASGQFVLVVQTQNEAEATAARDVISAAVGDYQDLPGEPAQVKKPT